MPGFVILFRQAQWQQKQHVGCRTPKHFYPAHTPSAVPTIHGGDPGGDSSQYFPLALAAGSRVGGVVGAAGGLGRSAALSDFLPHLLLAFSLTLPLNSASTRRKTSLPLALLFPLPLARLLDLARAAALGDFLPRPALAFPSAPALDFPRRLMLARLLPWGAAAALGDLLLVLAMPLALERGGFGETALPRSCHWHCCWRRR
ncbi:MAG: hypothetical protein LBG65_07055 [Puniceicoccales bacterium]|jgi:hypothetical protein|nr:hypothetical protein [Puniceicoccales bacterium]